MFGMKTVPILRLNVWRTLRLSMTKLLLLSIIHLTVFLISSHVMCLHISTQQINSENDNNKLDGVQWSNWSHWSPCSRSCDGGISVSLRKCLSPKVECVGVEARHRICNMQPCPIPTDFRAKQCSMFNNKPYRERFYEWLPFIDPTDPCALTCKANGYNFVAKLAPSVKDGTRCRLGSLDMCVDGKCLSVGCDLQLGSSTKIDECGICGGDGQSCTKHHYSWTHRYLTECSHACGGGFQLSNVFCLNKDTEAIVDDIFCNANTKPKPVHRSCNDFDCPPTWIAYNWTECDKKCGNAGKKTRQVVCAIVQHHNGLPKKVSDSLCGSPKPDTETKCNTQECPQWYEGLWSECSESCGNGTQTRPVVCRDSQGLSSDQCDLELKPIDRRNCSDISKCLHGTQNSQEDSPQLTITNKVTTEPSFIVGPWSACNVSCGYGMRHRKVECKIYLEFSQTELTLPPSQCLSEKPIDTEVCFEKDCEANQLELKYISEEKKPTVELSYQVVNDSSLSFSWRVAGFTQCSHPCLGGTQESLFECVRSPDNVTVDSQFCDLESKPDSYTRTCNDNPCPPRWNVTEFSHCSRECGEGGFQERVVRCVHEVTRGSTNLVIVPDDECKDQMPATKQACNQIDCPARWVVGPWSKCSKACGNGIKTRTIRCMKESAFNGLRETVPLECSIKKPKIIKKCGLKPCPSYLQRNLSNELSNRKSKRNFNSAISQEQVSLKVEGKADVYQGTMVKLRCPEWKSPANPEEGEHTRVFFCKGNERVHSGKRFHLARNMLKIKHAKLNDTAVYKCWFRSGDNVHSMFLHVLPRASNTTFHDLALSDYTSPDELRKKHYYKNELDLSQEMHSQPSRRENVNVAHRKGNARDRLPESDDSWEISQNRVLPLQNEQSESFQSANEVEPYFQKKKQINSLINDGNLKDLKFNWITTEWSKCTIPCGGIGFKMRLSQCYVQLENVTQAVESLFCTGHGLPQPRSIEKCGFRECSYWKTGKWSECDNCVALNIALQSRSVNCIMPNGTVVEDSYCSRMNIPKPSESQQCVNDNCIAYWRAQSWNKCNSGGYRSRLVQCIWRETNKVADSAQCGALKKPATFEKCLGASYEASD